MAASSWASGVARAAEGPADPDVQSPDAYASPAGCPPQNVSSIENDLRRAARSMSRSVILWIAYGDGHAIEATAFDPTVTRQSPGVAHPLSCTQRSIAG